MFCPPLVTKLGDEKTARELPRYEIIVPYKALQCMQTFFPDGSASSRDFIAPKVSLHAQVEAKKEQASSANSYFILQCLPLYDSQKREHETTVVIVAVGIYIFQTSFIVFYDGGKHEGRVQWAMTNRSS